MASARRALCLAVRDMIRLPKPTGLDIPDAQCEIMPDGRPAPKWGGTGGCFYSIHSCTWTKNRPDDSYERMFSLKITLTWLLNTPFDSIGWASMTKETDGFDEQMDQLAGYLMKNQWVIANLANTYIGSANNGFTEAMYPVADTAPQPQSENWFYSHPRSKNNQGMFVGMSADLRLEGAKQTQKIENL